MTGTYNMVLVGLSLVLGILASHAMLVIAERVRAMAPESGRRHWWLLGGSLAMGNGIWSTHFVGMLAYHLPMPVSYDPVRTVLSLILAACASYVALRVTTGGAPDLQRLGRGAAAMGFGIAAMHYTGMSAMRMEPGPQYRGGLVVLSVVIAVGVSWAALWVAFGAGGRSALLRRLAAPVVMGMAIGGAHYTGMSAVRMPATMSMGKAWGLGSDPTSILISLFSLGVLALTLTLLDSQSGLTPVLREEEREAHKDLDPVTGVSTRATFLVELDRKMAEARVNETMLGLVFVDLDGFKTINDSLGYTGGDAVLRAFADDLQRRTRANTVLGRLGADEFALVLDGFDDVEKVQPMARSILDRMTTEFGTERATMLVTSSVGIALYPRDGGNVDELLKSASVAMHHAKRSGKNSCQVFDTAMNETASRAAQITRGLAEALAQNQFSLVFQPKFDGRENRITGAEALIRWTHPVLGNIAPMDFIPLAEETGQIVPISEWVIREVCRQIVAWRSMGLDPVKVAINLSPEQLRLEGYAERIHSMVRAATVHPQCIMFEITETAAMREPKLAMAAIAEFQKAGFDIAIDDFGTGYSSMAYLQQFRVKELKIDRFFIGSLEEGAEGHTIVAAIIALAHALRMKVVAEGVETPSQLKTLNGMACDEVQGYLLGRPMVPGDFEKLLRSSDSYDELAAGSSHATHYDAVAAKPRLRSAMA